MPNIYRFHFFEFLFVTFNNFMKEALSLTFIGDKWRLSGSDLKKGNFHEYIGWINYYVI